MSFWYQDVPWDVGGENLANWVDFLKHNGSSHANLTHHISGQVELELLKTIPNNLSWAIHLSSKTLGNASLREFITTCTRLPTFRELLVISGNPKPKRTSLELLQELSHIPYSFPIAVAASPKDSDEVLALKLRNPTVQRVYLQLAEPEQWEPLAARIHAFRTTIFISACWLPPTISNWRALTLFPWSGSVLSEDWKLSLKYAEECAQRQLDWMRANNVTPLIEPRRITAALIDTMRTYHW